jgi:large subunit ribosomal protein LP1
LGLRACTLPLQADNINALVKAAGIEVEPYWPNLFAKLAQKKGIDDFILNVGAGAYQLEWDGGGGDEIRKNGPELAWC